MRNTRGGDKIKDEGDDDSPVRNDGPLRPRSRKEKDETKSKRVDTSFGVIELCMSFQCRLVYAVRVRMIVCLWAAVKTPRYTSVLFTFLALVGAEQRRDGARKRPKRKKENTAQLLLQAVSAC